MSSKIKKNEEYPLPEGCIAIQISGAEIKFDLERKVDHINYFLNQSPVDRYCMDASRESTLNMSASTLNDIIFLRGGHGMPSLNNKNVLIIITDEE